MMKDKNIHFTVTDEHIKLLRHMYVGWQDCEYGAPEIDPKRPYGNSSVAEDIHEILGWGMKSSGWDDLIPDRERAWKIHKEMQTVLQILISNLGIEPGLYQAGRYSNHWTPVQTQSGGKHKA